MEKIDIKYKIPVTGKYTRAVFICPHCLNEMLDNYFDNIIGFADAYVGLVSIVECDSCFGRFYSHTVNAYTHFIESIEAGTQKHFKPLPTDDKLKENDRFRRGIKRYGYNSEFRRAYESMTATLRYSELDTFFNFWNL